MEFPKELMVVNAEDGMKILDRLDQVEAGVQVGVYRLVRSGPVVRKVELGQPPRRPRKDKGTKRTPQPTE